MKPHRRKKNLILPALQMKMTVVFMASSACLLALMGYLCTWFLTSKAFASPSEAARIQDQVFPILINAFAISMALLVPVMLVVGILATFMVAGPIYHFEQFLRATLRGENPRDCRLRQGDELSGLCELLNDATRHLRTVNESEGSDESQGELETEEDRISTAA